MDILAIVVPCYNEEEVLTTCADKLTGILCELAEKGKISPDSFLLFVDDGSTDDTWSLIREEHQSSPKMIKGIKLSKNVGHQRCLTAGLAAAVQMSDCVITIDADLQDDILAIEQMVDKYLSGCEIVYGVRNKRENDSWFKRNTAAAFYRFLRFMGIQTVYNHADFRLMSRRAVEELSKYHETNLYLRGMVPLLGFKSDTVTYDRGERIAGKTKYPFARMCNLAFDGISSFSIRPIRFILSLGIIILFLSFFAFLYALISYLSGHVVAGWTSLILSIWFLGGLQLFAIGLVGEYIGKIYMEVKQRPRYHIENELLDENSKEL